MNCAAMILSDPLPFIHVLFSTMNIVDNYASLYARSSLHIQNSISIFIEYSCTRKVNNLSLPGYIAVHVESYIMIYRFIDCQEFYL